MDECMAPTQHGIGHTRDIPIVRHRVLIHLYRMGDYEGEVKAPPAVTQDGIGRTIGKSRSHAAVALKKLRDEGLVREYHAHAGARRRSKCYAVTPKGVEVAKELGRMYPGYRPTPATSYERQDNSTRFQRLERRIAHLEAEIERLKEGSR